MGEPPHPDRGQHNPNPLPKPLFSTKSPLQVEPGQAEPVLCVLALSVGRGQAGIADGVADPPPQHRVLPPSQGRSMVFWGTSRQSNSPRHPQHPAHAQPRACGQYQRGAEGSRLPQWERCHPAPVHGWFVPTGPHARLTWAVAAVLRGSLGSASPRVAASRAVCEGTRRHSSAMGLAGLQ